MAPAALEASVPIQELTIPGDDYRVWFRVCAVLLLMKFGVLVSINLWVVYLRWIEASRHTDGFCTYVCGVSVGLVII